MEGYWASFGSDAETGQPITTCEWVDRLAPKAWAVVAVGTCAAYGGIHAMQGNPTGAMGLADYLGRDWRSKARPLYLSSAFIIEEGFPIEELRRILASMREAAAEAGVLVVTGDTKVVQKGGADRLFIHTAGIGVVESDVRISAARAQVCDKVILSGTIGDHGTTIMIARGELELETDIKSDSAPLHSLVREMLEEAARASEANAVHCLRDPTRGGVAATLNEIALASEVCIEIEEARIPVREEVKGACEILGLDPLYVANEGKLIALVGTDAADAVVARMKTHEYGREACIIGEVKAEPQGIVAMRTGFGGTRIVDMLVGEQLPRIC